MKRSIIRTGIMLTGAILLSISALAQEQQKSQEKTCCDNKKKEVSCEMDKNAKMVSFKVYGKCGMCKDRIEKAAKGVEGVCSSEWDKETKMIELTYHPEKVKIKEVHEAVALVGHDTEKATASDMAYEGLPMCCKYDRK